MRETLYSLIELQEVDLRLDELMLERGDLPLIVEELQAKHDSKTNEFNSLQDETKKSKVRKRELELMIEEYKEKFSKYEEQLYQVKTNKEYDAITTETEEVKEKILEGENEILEIEEALENGENTIKELSTEIESLASELEENKVELKKTMVATAEEENLLKQEREIIINKSGPEIIKNYELVREARDGQGIAQIQDNVCGGCFSFIPPQKVVEVKKMKKIYTCEYCGRILVWQENS